MSPLTRVCKSRAIVWLVPLVFSSHFRDKMSSSRPISALNLSFLQVALNASTFYVRAAKINRSETLKKRLPNRPSIGHGCVVCTHFVNWPRTNICINRRHSWALFCQVLSSAIRCTLHITGRVALSLSKINKFGRLQTNQHDTLNTKMSFMTLSGLF